MINYEHEAIMQLSGTGLLSCDCTRCVTMCKTAPCLGTPSDMLRIINNGYIDLVEGAMFAAHGSPKIPIVRPKWDDVKKPCVFLDDQGKCKLHTRGLKPIEGKISNCKQTHVYPGKLHPSVTVAMSWMNPANFKTIELIVTALEK